MQRSTWLKLSKKKNDSINSNLMQMPILPDSYDQHPWIPETEQTSILWVLHKKYMFPTGTSIIKQ